MTIWRPARLAPLAAALAAACLLPAAASAAPTSVTFHVVAHTDVPQYAYVKTPSDASWSEAQATDGGGDITLSVNPGDVLKFSRNNHVGSPPSSIAPPEGADGLAYTVPPSPTSNVPITLPDVHEAYHPELSDAERWIVGKLNADRVALSRNPLAISTTLNSAADVMARDEAVNSRFPDPQFWVTNQEFGWPGDPFNLFSGGYVIADAPMINPAKVLAHWDGSAADGESPQIWSALSDPDLEYVGIGDGDGAWIIEGMFSCPDAAHQAACGITADDGDPTVYTPDLTAPSITISGPADGAHYAQGATVTAGYSCQDNAGGQGVAVCSGPVPSGAAVDTSSPGVKTFTVNASDTVGNASSKSVTYTVDAPAGGLGSGGGSGTGTGTGSSASGGAGGAGGSGAGGGGSLKPGVPLQKGAVIKVKKGIAAVTVACPRHSAGCKGSVMLKAGKKTKLGSARFSVAAGASTTVKIKLSARGRKLLAKARHHKLRATLKMGSYTRTVALVSKG